MPSGTAVKPGDVITQYNGKTVEVNNTDAEGRLILADALAYAIELGAERVIDLATLTGAVRDRARLDLRGGHLQRRRARRPRSAAAGEESGELVWRLPLHPEYKEMMKGTVADLSNLASKREAGTITAAAFLEEFVDGTPWAHIDIAGTAWDVDRAYTGKGGSGYGVRLLVQLARDFACLSTPPPSLRRRRSCRSRWPWASSLPLSAAVRRRLGGRLFAAAVEDRGPRRGRGRCRG